MLTAVEVLTKLQGSTRETIVHFAYVAGRPANEEGKRQFAEARDYNDTMRKSAIEYTGTFHDARLNKKGEVVITIFCVNRGEVGHFRSFNPELGTFLDVQVRHAA